LAVQLKSLQVQAIELGKDNHTVYLALGDASNSIWSIYCNQQNIKNAKKQSTAKQTSMKLGGALVCTTVSIFYMCMAHIFD